MKKNNNKGFTLVELIVVLVILAILAAILVPALLGYIDKAREGQYAEEAHSILTAAQGYCTEQYAKNPTATISSIDTDYVNTIVAPTDVSTISVKMGTGTDRETHTIKEMEVTFTSQNKKSGKMKFDGANWEVDSTDKFD